MTWEWSHTNEAYDSARNNLEKQTTEWLVECLSEWQATTKDSDISFNPDLSIPLYDLCKAKLEVMGNEARDIFINEIWELMSELRSCDNGGFNAYACPYGCHTVSFND